MITGDYEVIRQILARATRRRRWLRAWAGFWGGLLVGAGFWLAALAFYKVLPLPEGLQAVAAVVVGLASAIGFVRGWTKRISLMKTARWLDAHRHFQERLSTAWEWAQREREGVWRDLLLADVARRVDWCSVKEALPIRLPQLARWILVILALGAGLGFVPEYRTERYRDTRKQAAVIEETGLRLAELVGRQLEREPPTLESTREVLAAVQDLAMELGRAKLSRADALRELANASERLREELSVLGRNPALRRLERGRRSPGGGGMAERAEMEQQLEAMHQQLDEGVAKTRAAEELKAGVEALAQAAANVPVGDSASAGEAVAQLAQAMADLARRAEELGLTVPNVEEAIKGLERGQIDRVLRELQFAAIELDQLAQMARALEELQLQLADIGKDLAEQLEKGQGLAALSTLERMREGLRQGALSPVERARIRSDLLRAVPPGSEFGRLGELLQAAVERMDKADGPGAVDSLGEAADELRRLMHQLGDAQGLMAALGNLQTAQMCIGNGLGWSLGRSRVGGFRPGGRPGGGVGTWADEGLSMGAVQNSGLWDNSGVERPDLTPRGEADRGEGSGSDAWVPTRVRGQISPGASMPSITLRGLSVRGRSRLEYQEALTAAQVDARNALSQEQVPRAYQAAVRDYFDDLKQ